MESKEKTPDPATRDDCIQAVTALFPDICPEYLVVTASPLSYDTEAVINHIIDLEEDGASYARRPRTSIKRKRDEESDDEISQAKRKYCNPDRPGTSPRHVKTMKKLITGDFPLVRSADVQKLLLENRQNLAPTYLALTKIVNEDSQDDTHFKMMKTRPSAQHPEYSPENIEATIQNCQDEVEKEILQEFRAMRLIRDSIDNKKNKETELREAEQRNFDEAKARGDLIECECCFAEQPPNRLVRCDAEVFHEFCYDCARRNAETLVGLSKHELSCMSMDSCDAGFSRAEREKFLDDKLTKALERIEQEDALRLAGIENLARCPFCPYAAECPPVEIDREFRCQNPDCKIISCRLCGIETHIPLTCEEAVRQNGVQARREIEEAMTAALVRKCNKCNTPFIKESGCNKMTCTLSGCRNIQCYVCSKSCDYSHFNDPRRGGKSGNCPLFDVTETRHEEDVQRAEAEVKKRVAEQHPELDPEVLEIRMSDKVVEDDKRRQNNDPFANQGQLYLGGRRVDAEAGGIPFPAPPMVHPIRPGPVIHPGQLALPRAYNPDGPAPENLVNQAQLQRDRGGPNNVPNVHLQAELRRQARAHEDAEAQAQAQIQAELLQIQNNFEQMMQQRAQQQDQARRDQMVQHQLLMRQQQIAQFQAQQAYQQAQQQQALQEQAQQLVQQQAQQQTYHQPLHNIPQYQSRQVQDPLALQGQPRQQWHHAQQQRAGRASHSQVQKQTKQAKQQHGPKNHQHHQYNQYHYRNQQQKQHHSRAENNNRQPQPHDVNSKKRNVAPSVINVQPGQPRIADHRSLNWLNQLQEMNLGFGPMQGLDFGRSIVSNSPGPLGRGHQQHPPRDLRQMQPAQPVNNDLAVRNQGSEAHPNRQERRHAHREATFRVRYGAVRQAPAQPQ